MEEEFGTKRIGSGKSKTAAVGFGILLDTDQRFTQILASQKKMPDSQRAFDPQSWSWLQSNHG